jgi:hypothetical protein
VLSVPDMLSFDESDAGDGRSAAGAAAFDFSAIEDLDPSLGACLPPLRTPCPSERRAAGVNPQRSAQRRLCAGGCRACRTISSCAAVGR